MAKTDGRGKHPNSLAALQKKAAPPIDSERGKIMQIKSVEARKRNTLIRESLKATANEWKAFAEIRDDIPKAMDVIEMAMLKALDRDDLEDAGEYAKILLEYQTPKLARQENTNVEVTADDLSDEELDAKLKEFFKGEDK